MHCLKHILTKVYGRHRGCNDDRMNGLTFCAIWWTIEMPRDNRNPFDTTGLDVQRGARVTHLSSVVKDIAETDLFGESKRDFFFLSLCNVWGRKKTDNRSPFFSRTINILLLAQTAGVCGACWRQLSMLPLLSLILRLSFLRKELSQLIFWFDFTGTFSGRSLRKSTVFSWDRVHGTKTAPRQRLHQCIFAYCGCPFSRQGALARGHSSTARDDTMNHWNAAGCSVCVCVFTQSQLSIKHF